MHWVSTWTWLDFGVWREREGNHRMHSNLCVLMEGHLVSSHLIWHFLWVELCWDGWVHTGFPGHASFSSEVSFSSWCCWLWGLWQTQMFKRVPGSFAWTVAHSWLLLSSSHQIDGCDMPEEPCFCYSKQEPFLRHWNNGTVFVFLACSLGGGISFWKVGMSLQS